MSLASPGRQTQVHANSREWPLALEVAIPGKEDVYRSRSASPAVQPSEDWG